MASDICSLLGDRVRQLRKDRGWRQIDLAAHAALSKTHISDIESGRREVCLLTLHSLAEALDIPISKLMASIGH